MNLNEITSPEGYEFVIDGKVRSSDLCWGSNTKSWGHPTKLDWATLGSDVKNYYAVVRKIN